MSTDNPQSNYNMRKRMTPYMTTMSFWKEARS